MSTNKKALKELVKEEYSDIAIKHKAENKDSCCGDGATSTCCEDERLHSDYKDLKGYFREADLGLGCGIPTEGADIREGHVVLDLGSGAGNDCFVARSMTGAEGRVIGIDFSYEMTEKARQNARKLDYSNVEFYHADIENLPLNDDRVDVIISNCVLNLVPEKQAVFSEMIRILKPGGHFSVSDIVINGTLPRSLRENSQFYVGCIAGAQQEEEYLANIRSTGFNSVKVINRKLVQLSKSFFKNYLTAEEEEKGLQDNFSINSITVNGRKPVH